MRQSAHGSAARIDKFRIEIKKLSQTGEHRSRNLRVIVVVVDLYIGRTMWDDERSAQTNETDEHDVAAAVWVCVCVCGSVWVREK